ncbi:Hypothetical predicted protein [Cloeon dipterum]|uniref:Uncharacterized protein n=1 Tax=Cloeon dipterum TaxID=197152 RepID=A0A8S1D3U1_9INSE|nr:Hypothetical predicted protein [Cloeon dipterum]
MFAEFSLSNDLTDQFNKLLLAEEVSLEVLMEVLRRISVCVVSSNTIEILSRVIDKVSDTKINLSDFSELYPSQPDFELKVLELFSSRKADQISVLEINGGENSSNPPRLEKKMWTEIAKLKKLEKISITKQKFFLEDLMKMCKGLSSLREIRVLIDSKSQCPTDDPNFAQEFSKIFGMLKEFVYAPIGQTEQKESFMLKLTNFGIEHLPNANKIISEDHFCDMSEGCKKMAQTSQLQHVQLDAMNLEEVALNFDKFHSVRSLEFDWGERKVTDFDYTKSKKKLSSLKGFKSLTHLKFVDLSSIDYLTRILSFVGSSLIDLRLDYTPDNSKIMVVDLKLIQSKCPKLKHLEITETGVDDSEPMASFKSLRELEIAFKSDLRNKVKLSNILHAPNLEKVRLSGILVTKEEMQLIVRLIRKKAILTRIKSLILTLDGNQRAEMKQIIENEGRSFLRAVSTARKIKEENIKFDF